MTETILKTVITFLLSTALGYCASVIKNYKMKLKEKTDNEKVQNMALLTLLQAQLTNTFFVYNEIKQLPDYILRNWLNLFKIYKELGGNDYCDTLKNKIEKWEIKKTDILDK